MSMPSGQQRLTLIALRGIDRLNAGRLPFWGEKEQVICAA
jgi:hypothetical protein